MERKMPAIAPNISVALLWDIDLDKFDFINGYKTVIERVAERGTAKEWNEINRFYGEWQVRYTLMNEATFWFEETMDRVREKLGCPREHMYCYKHTARRMELLKMLPPLPPVRQQR